MNNIDFTGDAEGRAVARGLIAGLFLSAIMWAAIIAGIYAVAGLV